MKNTNCAALLHVFMLLGPVMAAAQTQLSIEWEKSLGGRRNETDVKVIAATKDGGCVIAGYSWSEDKFLPLTQGEKNVIIIRFDREGRMLWYSKPYNRAESREALYRAVEDEAGNLYFAGILWDPGVAEGAWLLKMDASGNTIWSKTYGGSGSESFSDIDLLPDGRIWASGTTTSLDGDVPHNAGKEDLWLVEVDSAGKLLQSYTYGSEKQEELASTEPMPDGGFLITGIRPLKPFSGPYSSTDFLDEDNFVVLTDSEGQILDSLQLRDSLVERACWHFFPTPEGFVGTGEYKVPTKFLFHFYAVQYDKQWNIVREKIIGGGRYESYGDALYTTEGNILLMGRTSSEEGIADPRIGIADLWLVCLDMDLNLRWTTRYGQERKFLSALRFTAAADGSGYLVAGDISRSTLSEESDFWLAKFVEKPSHGNNPCYDFSVSPNPFSGNSLLKVGLRYAMSEDVPWELFDASGKFLGSGTFRPGSLVYTPLSEHLPDGIYYLRLFCLEGVAVNPIVKITR